jgi:lipopolysaccharide/colanic/teichoic acid biosynthesis glycosyltransferase
VRPAKRAFDLLFAVPGIILLSPLLAIVAIAIRVTDGSPVLFMQRRVGRHGVPFQLAKFRTMRVRASNPGRSITVGSDPRITRIGSTLRRLKLDELPQLWNVIRGDMSLVGPRPEVPEYVAMYSDDQARVLELTPGITDPASLRYRNESEILAKFDDPDKAYAEQIMPAKLNENLEYAARATLASDLGIILRTVLSLGR